MVDLLSWWKKRCGSTADPAEAWRSAWSAAVDEADEETVGRLRTELEALAVPGRDVELEFEMLEALERLQEVRRQCAAGALPVLETQHRVIAAEPCHFTAPASLAADAAQPSGRVLATATRLVFIGGARTTATPWHTVHRIARIERDLVLLRPDESSVGHYRFNTYGDAVVAAHLAAHFKAVRGRRL